MPDTPPPAFDPAHYRAVNGDLGHLDDAGLRLHYEQYGRAEGRVAAPMALREALLTRIGDGRSVLEIGPFCSPLLRGRHVEYLDVLDAGQLRRRAAEIGADPAGCPELIHHVGDLDRVQRRFDAVVSSHAIEHQPDLVRHLNEVARILEPGGAFFLMIPDKRYCFDHFIAESTIADILQAHHERRRRHDLASVIEHAALATHNDPARHWAGDHGAEVADRTARVEHGLALHAAADGGYVDVHAWYFTPDSFRLGIDTLAGLGLIALAAAEVYDTPFQRNEFCAVLRRVGDRPARVMAAAGRVEAEEDAAGDKLSEAPPALPDPALAGRIIAAWERAGGDGGATGLGRALDRGDAGEVAAKLAALGGIRAGDGLLGGQRERVAAQDAGRAARMAQETRTMLAALAQAVGMAAGVDPSGYADDAMLFAAIEAAAGMTLSPPERIGGYLGLDVGAGTDGGRMILHPRMIAAIHDALRLREALETIEAELGLADDAGVVELGGAAGLTAFYARRLGIGRYTVAGDALVGAVQGYLLAGAFEDVALLGETGDVGLRILPETALASSPGDFALALNTGDFSTRDPVELPALLASTAARHLLSLDRPLALPGWRRVRQHRHWLHADRVEEVWARGS